MTVYIISPSLVLRAEVYLKLNLNICYYFIFKIYIEGFSKVSSGMFSVFNIQCFLKHDSVHNIPFTRSKSRSIFKIKFKYMLLFYI